MEVEHLNFRYIPKKDLSEVGSLPLLVGCIYSRPSNPDFRFIFDIKFERITYKHKKRIKQEFYGMYVNVEDEDDLKVLIPIGAVSKVQNICYFKDILNAEYYIGNSSSKFQVRFTNPKMFGYSGYIVCDIDYKLS